MIKIISAKTINPELAEEFQVSANFMRKRLEFEKVKTKV